MPDCKNITINFLCPYQGKVVYKLNDWTLFNYTVIIIIIIIGRDCLEIYSTTCMCKCNTVDVHAYSGMYNMCSVHCVHVLYVHNTDMYYCTL